MPHPLTPGILFSQMEPPPELTARFHDWYDNDHVPARTALDGFLGARRFHALDGSPQYLAIYELESLAALETDAYRQVKTAPSALTREMLGVVHGFTRYTCEQVSDFGEPVHGSVVSVVAFTVPDEDEDEFDAWYEQEHVPMLLLAPDWLRVRRYRVLDGEGGPWTHLAVHELRSAEVMDSPERTRARIGPRRDELVSRPWFGDSGRWLYQELSRVTALIAD
ncbi:MAG TPA: hypothetical protein VHW44_15510 [Pseudonocardiaceae bacterium]|jgi:hypothetical protein|nr:hypothetical protein [Pseudonocardiaceae bacterium]